MERESHTPPGTLELDTSLLEGFRFSCRPECGLCCFTSPRLMGEDERRLRHVAPAVPIISRDGERCVAARPDGGACQLLREFRCAHHAARPAPCREFPVSVHVGARLQATLVLSCPGLALDRLESFEAFPSHEPVVGLDSELGSVRARIGPATERLRAEALRRRRRVVRELSTTGRWVDDTEVRRLLGVDRLIPGPEEYLPSELPELSFGLERLPMCYDGRRGPMVLAQSADGWEAHELFPEGGSRRTGMAVPPAHLPEVDQGAEALLVGYLRYWLSRDCFLGAVQQEMLARTPGTVAEVALEELHAIASDVLARGAVRAQLRGDAGVRLTRRGVEDGIRATDQDWLDRPTWGSRL